jgi:hypothetical protein
MTTMMNHIKLFKPLWWVLHVAAISFFLWLGQALDLTVKIP